MILLLLACKSSVVGELRVTEVHPLPLDTPGQWLELTFLDRKDTVSLGGTDLSIGGEILSLPDVDLGPGERFVIGTADVDTAVVPVDLEASFDLTTEPTLTLRRGTEVLHSVEVAELPYDEGSSATRDPERADDEDPWCMSWEVGDGDFATPGELAGACRCRVEFTYHFQHVTDPALDIEGEEGIVFLADGRYTVPGTNGVYERTSDALGQHVAWTYEETGISYSGTRPYGSDAFVDQPITIPEDIEDFVSGTWSSTGLCVAIGG